MTSDAAVFTVEVAGYTDRGTVRNENQDAWDALTLPWGAALVVADGMGGHHGGRESAEAAVHAASASLRAFDGSGDLTELVRAAVHDANVAVDGVRQRIGGDPGTTLVIAAIGRDGRAVVGNVGDSRAYLITSNEARPITEDHSWVAEQVRAGLLDAAATRDHLRRNVITRAVMGDEVVADTFTVQLEPGVTLMLCSDGVWEPLSDHAMAAIVNGTATLHDAARRLCTDALSAGSADNVTAAAARCIRQVN